MHSFQKMLKIFRINIACSKVVPFKTEIPFDADDTTVFLYVCAKLKSIDKFSDLKNFNIGEETKSTSTIEKSTQKLV